MFNVAMASKWHVHAEGYAREVAEVPGVKITAVWDEQPQRGQDWADCLDAAFEPDFAWLLARPDVDGIIFCSPTSMHKELIIAAARAGKHIFTEKVLTFTKKDAMEVAEAVRQAGVRFVISYPRKAWGSVLYAKQALDSGILGQPTLMLARTSHNGATAGWLPDSFFNEAEAGGGAMMDFGAHPMYLARMLLGKPVRITSLFNRFTGKALDDNAVSVIEFENKALAVLQTSFITDHCPNTFELHGTLGSVTQENPDKPVKCTAPEASVDDDGFAADVPATLPSPLTQWAEGHEVPGCGIAEAIELSELMEGAYKAYREGRTVEFAEL